MFVDLIREAKNEQEIYFLLATYVEAVRFVDPLNTLPNHLKRPRASKDDVRRHCRDLEVELEKRSGDPNNFSCMLLREALPIFRSASERLETLGVTATMPRKRRHRQPEARRRRHHAGA